ncbi:cytochrome C oxidase subunit IV family protein [Roseateles agri]|uniref:cytochrome C oxidase subunit IV family protein n=1 Tax=Roseateles agri TaxID=3098619 RepID=UPI003D66C6B7
MRRLVLAWLALLVLLGLSAASAKLPALGQGLLVVSLLIAAGKAVIVGWVFMELGQRRPLLRLVAACGLAALMLLGGLSWLDLGLRRDEPSRWQVSHRPCLGLSSRCRAARRLPEVAMSTQELNHEVTRPPADARPPSARGARQGRGQGPRQ